MQGHRAIQYIVHSRLVHSLRTLASGSPRPERNDQCIEASTWDEQYARGRWEYLGNLSELARYAVISAYCAHRRLPVSVLDLDCGAGLLRRWLRPELLNDYVGVDLSEVAVERGRRESDRMGSFVAADIAAYEPNRRFDAIVFNEVLYYLADPGEVLRRYVSALQEGGVFIISLWESPESRQAWRRAAAAVAVIDTVEFRNQTGFAWTIRLCGPAAA